MRSSFLAAMAALALVNPTAAQAMPGDLPFAPNSPGPDATVLVNPEGIPVGFSCPVYRIADPGFPLYGGARDYGVSFSKAPTTGPDGRLANPVALGTGAQIPGFPDQCASALAAGGSVRPQETPGSYYWQVWRLCTGCPPGYEVGPVLKLTLRSNAEPTLSLPKRIYAGYPVIGTVGGDGLPAGTPLVVERRRGAGWVKAGAGTVRSGSNEPTVILPRGKQTVRVTVTTGGQTLTSARITRTVLAASAKTNRVAAGRYRGTNRTRFTVKGRSLRDFSAQVPMLCPGVTPGTFTTELGNAAVKRIRLAPDGGFVGVATSGDELAVRVRGRLSGTRLTGGRVELSVRACTGNTAFRVKRG